MEAAAQPSYLSIFGANACGAESFTLNNVGGPLSFASFTGLPSINDVLTPVDNKYPLAHSVYNNMGQVLFSVDQNGIYTPSGGPAYPFVSGHPVTISAMGTTYTVQGKEALSEISTFPCRPGDYSRYYAVFWAKEATSPQAVLRAVRIDIASSGILSFTNNILYDANSTTGFGASGSIGSGLTTEFTIAADIPECDGSRYVYTTDPTFITGSGGGIYGSILRKWKFGADGSLPAPSVSTYFDKQYYASWLQQAKILKIGTTKYYTFASNGNIPGGGVEFPNSRYLVCWDISSPRSLPATGTENVAVYDAGSGITNISGFEYAFSDGVSVLYLSRFRLLPSGDIDPANSGLITYNAIGVGSIATSFTALPGTSAYCYTDLQFLGGDNLLMVGGAISSANGGFPDGVLSYMPAFGTPVPILLRRPCRPIGIFSVLSRTNMNYLGGRTPFYLGKQFDETLRQIPEITDISISNRCAPGSYGATAANPQYIPTVTGAGGIPAAQYLWTPVPPMYLVPPVGLPVPIFRNNAHLDNYTIPRPSIVSVSDVGSHGGVPSITADFILTVTNREGCTATKEIKTDLITSGFDLASRDSHFDLYNEANTQTINPNDWNIWSSPDIFNRYHADGGTHMFEHESPDYAYSGITTNYLYVNVRNVGCTDYDPTTATPATLHSYWTMGGFSSETWPTAWDGTGRTPLGAICGPRQPLGAELTTQPIPYIAAGSSTTVEIPWTPPNPQDYYPLACTPGDAYMELCFLSRIVDYHNITGAAACAPDGMTICETTTGTETNNVNNNNNIATLNTSIAYVNTLPTVRPHIVIAGNGGVIDAPFNIQFVNESWLHAGGHPSTLSNYVSIKVFLGDLFDVWQSGGSKGIYTLADATEKSVTFDGSNAVSLNNVMMKAGMTYPVGIEFRLLPGVDGKQMPEEVVNFRQISLDKSIDTLVDSITVSYVDTTYDSTLVATYDTLYATMCDTTYHQQDSVYSNYSFQLKYQAPTKGVLTVTKISNGPQDGCDYAQIMVSNCGDNTSPTVDVRGWVVDDNSGNFDLEGCTVYAGVTQSHYRLAYNDIWANVPVGSMLIVYNSDSNCYNMSDTFKVDTVDNKYVYWVPLGKSITHPSCTSHMEKFKIDLAPSLCTYVVDSTVDSTTVDSSYYQVADDWQHTIAFDVYGDAFQVRCPRCDQDVRNEPAFYHGVGYGPTTGSHTFHNIARNSYDLGGALIPDAGGRSKYTFIGSTSDDLSDPLQWVWAPADPSGIIPAAITTVNSSYAAAVQSKTLHLPCCAKTEVERKANNSGGNTVATTKDNGQNIANGLKIYPVPATMELNFQYSLTDNVTIKISDITGRLIEQQELHNSSSATFNVSKLTTGVYLYQVITRNKTQSGKVVVEK